MSSAVLFVQVPATQLVQTPVQLPSSLTVIPLQVPSVPEALHALQSSVQAVLQQYPSTQKPEEHSIVAEQVTPLGFKTPTLPPET